MTIWSADWVVTMDGEPLRDGAVIATDGVIVEVVPAASVTPDRHFAGGVLTPGLVNAHAHLEYGERYADLATSGLPFPLWIREMTRRRLDATPESWGEQAADGVRRLLATGTTCVADVASRTGSVAAVADAGLAGTSFVEAVGAGDARWPTERERLLDVLASAPAGASVGVSPHALYTLGTEVFRSLIGLARERGLRLHPHLAETTAEAEFVLTGTGPLADTARGWGADFEVLANGGYGVSPAAHLDALGGLGSDVHVAHGVHLSAADRALLRARGTSVVLCTRSNAVLGAGEAPVAALRAEGSPVAVGTDSLASSPSLDLLDELRALRSLALAQGSAEPGLDRWLIEAATTGGAAALGRTDVGLLRPGARADIAVFAVAPGPSPFTMLVDAGRCVATMLGGRVVHERIDA